MPNTSCGGALKVIAISVAVTGRHLPARMTIGTPAHRQVSAVSLTLHGKKPGAGLEPQAEELSFMQQPGSDIRPYDRLIGAALDGDRWLFARQDTVEAAWEIVDPVLGDVVPVHPYAKGSWGPTEAERLLPDRDTWYDPAAEA